MKGMILMAVVLLALGAGQASAQPCSTTGRLSQNDIKTALVGKWACAKDGADMWNEQLVGTGNAGTFSECHSGLTTGPDPIDTNKGSWSTSNAGGFGALTYTYPPSGGSYTYWVYGSGPYTFCRPSDNKTYTVYITTCPPPTLNNCP